jgi:hypothetical protein
MVNPRRTSTDAHISGYKLPRLTDADWEDLQTIANVSLDDTARTDIQNAANQFTEETLLQIDGASRAETIGQALNRSDTHKEQAGLTRFRKSLHRLVANWRDADADPKTSRLLADFFAETKNPSNRVPDFELALNELEKMAFGLDQFLSRIEERVIPIDEKPFTTMVKQLEKTVSAAGGTVSAATLTDRSKQVSSFVRFVSRLNESLPKEVIRNHTSDGAWSKRVSRALRT